MDGIVAGIGWRVGGVIFLLVLEGKGGKDCGMKEKNGGKEGTVG